MTFYKFIPTVREFKAYKNQTAKTPFKGGETEANKIFERLLKDEEKVAMFNRPEDNPMRSDPSLDNTDLNPYIAHGSLSIRDFYWRVRKVLMQRKGKRVTLPPVSLMGQALWREYFYLAAYSTKNFHRMSENHQAAQIDWDTEPKMAEAWAQGRTGYPAIDATMRQLKQEGWVHHLGR